MQIESGVVRMPIIPTTSRVRQEDHKVLHQQFSKTEDLGKNLSVKALDSVSSRGKKEWRRDPGDGTSKSHTFKK